MNLSNETQGTPSSEPSGSSKWEGRRATPHASASSRLAPDESVLASIHLDEVNVVVWRRPLPRHLSSSLADLARRDVPTFEGLIRRSLDLESALELVTDETAREWLRADLVRLHARFLQLASARHVKLSFGPVVGDQCRKFHVDRMHLRLITTYSGPGTEWLPNDAVDRDALLRAPECPMEANQHIVTNPGRVQRAVAGDVLLLKGSRYPGALGAVHRSPPIESSNGARLVLVLSTYHPLP
jgi:hypothetical protein